MSRGQGILCIVLLWTLAVVFYCCFPGKVAHVDDRDQVSVLYQTSSSLDVRRLLEEVDSDVLERFKAAKTGYRRHPSYYSDKYLTRGGPVLNQNELDQKWGRWTLVDAKRSTRPGDDFYQKYPNRDVPWTEFPANAWQKDTEYLPKFLDESIALVERALEAILTEYGHGKDIDNRPFEERIKLLGVVEENLNTKERPKAGASAVGDSYKGLVRRILHAVVTEDTFTLAMSGHSAAAGHGNHFQQSYTHAYGVIMEPIFARLGVHSMSRNFGFGGLGTIQTGIGASALIGKDVDLLCWDSGMTEGGVHVGILPLQAMLGGDRVPYFLADVHGKFAHKQSQGKSIIGDLHEFADADVGISGSGDDFIPQANSMSELESLPWATQYLNCGPELREACRGNHYRGQCWIDRTSFEWGGMNMSFTPANTKQAEPGGRAGWHPGDRYHQKLGRALAGFLLNGLRDALYLWKNSDNLVLQDDAWHVTAYYNNIRNKITGDFASRGKEWCRSSLLPERLCQVPMQAATEFTPRYDAARTSLRQIMKATRSPMTVKPNVYDPPDVYNPHLHAPPGTTDVLQIVENGVAFVPNFSRIRRRDSLSPADSQPPQSANMQNQDIVPGKGWHLNAVAGADMCDGEYDSWCNRGADNACMLYGHNDYRGQIIFDSFSGWGIFELSNMKEGLILIKYHDWLFAGDNPQTNGWCSENNETPCEASPARDLKEHVARQLKPPVPAYCDEFQFEFAIDGKITIWDKDTWLKNLGQVQRVVQVTTLLDDPNFTGGASKNVELGIRMTGCGRQKIFGLTHIYWA